MIASQREIKIVPKKVTFIYLLNPNCLTVRTASNSLGNWGGFLFLVAYVR